MLCFCEKWASGGIESFLTNIYECMDRTDIELDVVCCQMQGDIYEKRLARVGVGVEVLSGDVRALPKNLRLFDRLLRRGRYNVAHMNLYEGLGLLFAWRAHVAGVGKVIVHSHNTDLRPSALRLLKLAAHHACVAVLGGCSDVRWAPSSAAAGFMFGGRSWRLVHNGIVPERFGFDGEARQAMRRELGLGDSFVLGCVGRLCAQKNQAFLLEVLACTDDEVKLLLVGEDDGALDLTCRADELGVADRIIFAGVRPDVERSYQAMDALCVPSLFEGLGIVAVEGQAAGLPVLCSPAVPPEARVSDLLEALPLAVDAWADAIGRLWACRKEGLAFRASHRMVDAIKDAGYDRRQIACLVREEYVGGKR